MNKELKQAWLNTMGMEPNHWLRLTALQANGLVLEYERLVNSSRDTELKINHWYKNNIGSIVNYQGDNYGFGLTRTRNWYNNNGWGFENKKLWKPVDDSEVKSKLILIARDFGLITGNMVKSNLTGMLHTISGGDYVLNGADLIVGTDLGSVLILSNGYWAKSISKENPKFKKIEQFKRKLKKYEDDIDSLSNQIEELSKQLWN